MWRGRGQRPWRKIRSRGSKQLPLLPQESASSSADAAAGRCLTRLRSGLYLRLGSREVVVGPKTPGKGERDQTIPLLIILLLHFPCSFSSSTFSCAAAADAASFGPDNSASPTSVFNVAFTRSTCARVYRRFSTEAAWFSHSFPSLGQENRVQRV